ncbi:MAG: hypothetical protein ACLPY1_24330 [Terracidiphilus sp.]
MKQGLSRPIAVLLICGFLIAVDAHAKPTSHAAFDGLGTDSKTTLVVATLVAVVAVIGVAVYFAVHHAHTVKGCVAGDGAGLELQTEDSRSFVLLGATTGIKAGDRVKVTGARKKKVNGVSDRASFVVDKLDKDYGVCTASPAHP